MDTKQEDSQRKEFRNILNDLAKSVVNVSDSDISGPIYKRLEKLYDAEPNQKRFRHFYSDIYAVLTDIQKDPSKGSIQTLSDNIQALRNEYEPVNTTDDGQRVIDISDALTKLHDHVNLDVARINFTVGEDQEISGEDSIREIKSKITEVSGTVNNLTNIHNTFESKLNKELEKVGESLRNSQNEYITILGIFAAVVLSFTSGIAFSTSVLSSISSVSIYRIVMITLLIGLVLFNAIYALFYFVSTLVMKEISLKPLRNINIILIVLIIATLLAWWCGTVEYRNRIVC